MKKLLSVIFVLLVFCLASCGIDTTNWPKTSLPFYVNHVGKVSIEYTKKDQNSIIAHDYLEFEDKTYIQYLYYRTCGWSFEPKRRDIPENYDIWIEITFTYIASTTEQHFSYYEYNDDKIIAISGRYHLIMDDFKQVYFRLKEMINHA